VTVEFGAMELKASKQQGKSPVTKK
jgi:hypothetical protein